MVDMSSRDPILDMYLLETSQLAEQLESVILSCETSGGYSAEVINEIFRAMHTIKGSSAMMMYDNIATWAHVTEDLFAYMRQEQVQPDNISGLSDLLLEGVDFIKVELLKIKNGDPPDGRADPLIEGARSLLRELSGQPEAEVKTEPASAASSSEQPGQQEESAVSTADYMAIIRFEDGCEMENIRAYQVVHGLPDTVQCSQHVPSDILENPDSAQRIKEQGFQLFLCTEIGAEELRGILSQTSFIRQLELHKLQPVVSAASEADGGPAPPKSNAAAAPSETAASLTARSQPDKEAVQGSSTQTEFVSVSVTRLDELMNLVGELVIAESMVTQHSELRGLPLEQFHKAAHHLYKITNEIQDKVMSIRMVPLANTFQKTHRIVRDMSKKLDKDVQLVFVGEETAVDKTVIERVSDPILHLVRNAVDHGLETTEERKAKGKPPTGTLTLEARNAGSEVLVMVKEDGRGLNKDLILSRARERGLLHRSESDMSDREIYNLILLPGFSTKENITEYSGRGVGMDVVLKNIESIGGSVVIDSMPDEGTVITLRIPLTLAIIDGMNLKVGDTCFTLPIPAIRESFKPRERDVVIDPDGNEMIMVRGQCYPILRLRDRYKLRAGRERMEEGILVMVEQDGRSFCLFADELIGQQQVVVKSLPPYMNQLRRVPGISGCTMLGDGSISLILDAAGLR